VSGKNIPPAPWVGIKGWASYFFTNTDEGVGGCQTGEAGSFPDTNREVLGGTKIHLFEFGVKYLNFGATYLIFGAIYLNLGAIYLNLVAIYLNLDNKIGKKVFSNGEGGGGGGGFGIWCREKIFRPPVGEHFHFLPTHQ